MKLMCSYPKCYAYGPIYKCVFCGDDELYLCHTHKKLKVVCVGCIPKMKIFPPLGFHYIFFDWQENGIGEGTGEFIVL